MDSDSYDFDAPQFVDFTQEEDTNRRLSEFFDLKIAGEGECLLNSATPETNSGFNDAEKETAKMDDEDTTKMDENTEKGSSEASAAAASETEVSSTSINVSQEEGSSEQPSKKPSKDNSTSFQKERVTRSPFKRKKKDNCEISDKHQKIDTVFPRNYLKADTPSGNTSGRSHSMKTRSNYEKPFEAVLRSYKDNPTDYKAIATKVTIPKPFHFQEKAHPGKDVKSKQKFVALAEQLQSLNTKTPERFRMKPKQELVKPGSGRKLPGSGRKLPGSGRKLRRSLSHPELTVPQTPKFQSRQRSRPLHVKSREELETEEVEKMKSHQFKAAPLNKRILQKPRQRTKTARSPTKIEGFDLEIDRRAEEWKKHRHEESDRPPVFHANPIPKAVLQGPSKAHAPKQLPLTIPESPAFALKNRLRSTLKVPEILPNEPTFKPALTRKVPQLGIPFLPKYEHKVTEPQPFSFHEREMKRLKDKEDRIKQQLQEGAKSFEFHANPIPDLSPVLPARQTRSPTKPKPFDLEIDHRGQVYSKRFQEKVKEEKLKEKENTKIKAQPATVTKKDPFIPQKSNKPLTEPANVEFATDKRHEERAEYERWKAEKEQELATVRKAIEHRQDEEQKADLERKRKETVHQAQPVRHYKNILVKPSTKPLTRPVSPKFSDRFGRRSRTISE